MILKIYLFLGCITFIVSILSNLSLINGIKRKYKDNKNLKNTEKDIPGTILSYLKLLITCFIPIYHLLLLFLYLFMGEKINKKAYEMVEDKLKSNNNV